VTSSLLCPNILLSTTLSNTLSLPSSLTVSDHVPHLCNTTANYTEVHLNLYNFR
jgi:hypothetical protein